MKGANISKHKLSETPGFRNRIRVFSFVLTILVIWIHSPSMAVLPYDILMQGCNMQLLSIESLILSISSMAVPGFFMLSGYLFFRDLKEERLIDRADLGECCGIRSRESKIAYGIISTKIMKRVRTLLVPYILWNLIYYGLNIVAKQEPLTLGNLFDAVVHYRYNPVFWYMHQLIRVTVLTPVLYLLLKCRRMALPMLAVLLAMAVEYELFPLHFANEDAVFYYACGAVCALHFDMIDKLSDRRRQLIVTGVNIAAAVLMLCLSGIQFEIGYKYFNTVHVMILTNILFRILGAFALMNVLKLVDSFRTESEFNAEKSKCIRARSKGAFGAVLNISFFIYAVHPIEIKLVKIVQELLGYASDGVVMFGAFMLMPVLCYIMTYIIYRFMSRFMNRIYLLLTGGR